MSSGLTIWFTGLSGAGKTTTALALIDRLNPGRSTFLVDGDEVRGGLSKDLGFSAADRAEQVRRAGEVAILAARQGHIAVVSLVSPANEARDAVRARHDAEGIAFVEVYVATPLEVCIERDPKSLYAKAATGSVEKMTGVSDPYEPPLAPELTIETHRFSTAEIVEQMLDALNLR